MIKIDTKEFVSRIVKKGMAQSHLDQSFVFHIGAESEFPADIKKMINTVQGSFFGGGQGTYYICFKQKDGVTMTSEEAKIKLVKFTKTNLLVDADATEVIDTAVACILVPKETEEKQSSKDPVKREDSLLFGFISFKFV